MQSQNTSEYRSPLLLNFAERPFKLMAQETISVIQVKPITKNILITTFIRCLCLWAFSLSVVVIALSVPQNPKVIFHTKMTKKTKIESCKNDQVIFWKLSIDWIEFLPKWKYWWDGNTKVEVNQDLPWNTPTDKYHCWF